MQVLNGEQILQEDLIEARLAGVGEGDLPFLEIPVGASAAVLLIHGFSATPWEMRPLSEVLTRRGFACLAVRLPGHGTSPEDLARRRWEEWSATVLSGYDRLARHFPRIYAAGLSTGSLLALILARRRELSGLVLLSPYLRLRHNLAPYARWLRYLRPYQTRMLSDAAALHYYTRRPLAGVHQINRLLHQLKPQLGSIGAPVLALHGKGDEVIDIDSGRQLVQELGSAVKHYRCFGPEVAHVLTAPGSPRSDEILTLVGDFLEELEAQVGGGVRNC